MHHLLTFGLGIVVATATCAVRSSRIEQHNFKRGQSDGQMMAKLAFAEAVKILGTDYKQADGYDPIVEVKDIAIVRVERNGIKTLSLYNPSAK